MDEEIEKKRKDLMNAYLNKLQELSNELNKITNEITEIVFEVDTSTPELSVYEYIKTTTNDEELTEVEVLNKYGKRARDIVHEMINIVHEYVRTFLYDLIYYDEIVLIEEPIKIILSLI